jgi:hypothetical protein
MSSFLQLLVAIFVSVLTDDAWRDIVCERMGTTPAIIRVRSTPKNNNRNKRYSLSTAQRPAKAARLCKNKERPSV